MKIIISPAKKMIDTTDSFEAKTIPMFIDEAKMIYETMKNKSSEELKKIWKCNDELVKLNSERLQRYEIHDASSMALVAYQGLQFQEMAAHIFSDEAWNYVNENLYIISGLYGLLKPTDAVVLYRLEMQSKLNVNEHKDLYSFWSDKIASSLASDEIILNLASKEYSTVVERWNNCPLVSCVFGELIEGRLKIKGTLAKMARGSMVRYCAENQVETLDEVKQFCEHGFVYNEDLSNDHQLVFVK